MQVSAAGFAQKVTLKEKNASLESVISKIRIQTGYDFVFDFRLLENSKKVNITLDNAELQSALKEVFKNQNLNFTIKDNIIVLEKSTSSFLDRLVDRFSNIDVRGRVVDSAGNALSGATVRIKGTNRVSITVENGSFSFVNVDEKAVLVISYTGYENKELSVTDDLGNIRVAAISSKLEQVEIVSTGYQTLPKERATGSFTLIDNKTVNRAVSSDFLSRLKGVTNGLLFDISSGNSLGISIRGKSTLFSDAKPLIILDNFPFEGDLSSINPNDIENITLLKDASAASIWGVRAGNGVIVVTTQKGKMTQKPEVEFNTNLTLGGKPDLYYQPQLTSSEFIDIEKSLFDAGAYDGVIDDGFSTISPVISILKKIRQDPTFTVQGMSEIDKLKSLDVRDQLSKYFYRKSSRQQYYMAIGGGGTTQSYRFSAGYDKNLPNLVSTSDTRLTIKGDNTFRLLNDRLKLSTGITFSSSKSKNTNPDGYLPYLPYEQVADVSGNPLDVVKSGGLRAEYTDTAGNGKLLDWKFRPLDELNEGYSYSNNSQSDYRLNLGLKYKIISPLTVSADYQYYGSKSNNESSHNKESFFTRDLVNTYSSINSLTGNVTQPIPVGDIYSPEFLVNQSDYGRFQMDYNQTFGIKHSMSVIAGAEIRNDRYKYNSFTLYGYQPETATNRQIDFVTQLPFYYGSNTQAIGSNSFQQGTIDRYLSYFGNASYSYDNKYIISGSYRKDESNLFGVKANQKGVPLWSTGFSWDISKESFFNRSWLSSLILKATYGYNGNVNKSISAYLTATPVFFTNVFNTRYYQITNPPNDNLRWERVRNINLGLYFATKSNRISGSFEYFSKKGVDLIASSPIAPQTGLTIFTGNTANTSTNGLDFQLNSQNILGSFKWNTVAIFDIVKDKVTKYNITNPTNSTIVNATSSTISPVTGYPINSVFAYPWSGLDELGNPKGTLGNVVSTDYSSILNLQDRNELIYFGSGTPTVYGSLRNTFSYKMIEVSFNITYKLNYFFRASSINYFNLYYYGGYQQSDYSNRWQKSGDELHTNVPSAIYPPDGNREDFYRSSAILVQKGDHIRLQDIQLNYTLTKTQFKNLPLQNLNIYFYATNLGIVWRANKKGLDPDQILSPYPSPKIFSLGLKTNF
ncbi:MAG: SusC/RagA family TonB-linked outer membrane protein [Bacteroidota bacterium]